VEPAENWIIADFLSTRNEFHAFLSARSPGRMAREERVRMCSRKWLIVALVACGLASACSQYNTNLSIQTSSSVLTFVSPSAASVGGQGFTITANGSGFTTGALILWNGTALSTTLVSSLQLTAPVPASDLTTVGTVQVAVQIPGSAQAATQNVNNTTTTEVSNIVLFTIGAAPGTPPAIASLSPVSMPFCGSLNGFTLTVNAATGTTFTSDSVVNWNGSQRATTVTSSTQLTATILPSDTASNGTAAVSVSNSAGTSNTLQFTISTPTANLPPPVLGSGTLSPTSALAGSAAFVLTITSNATTNFVPCSVAQWVNSSNVTTSLPTTYVAAVAATATSPAVPPLLLASVPASDLLAPGNASVKVFTPIPGGGTSQAVAFTINQPTTPTITSVSAMLADSTTLSPTAPTCSPASFTLVVNGSNFVNGGSVVNWNGSPRPTTFVQPAATTGNPTPPPYLTAIIPFSDAVTQGSFPITVSNGFAVSNPMSFSVTTPTGTSFPAPTATMLAPAGTTAGAAQFPLTVTGTNFLPCSVIQWNGTPRATTYLSPTQLSTTILATDVLTAGSVPVTVFTPAPGGGTSAAISFTISPLAIASLSASTTQLPSTPYCSTTGFILTVTAATGTIFTSDSVVNWNGSPRATTFVSGTQLTAAITYADTAALGTATVFVSNTVASSNSLTFTMTAPTSFPAPSISSLAPSSAAAGGGAFILSVNGSNLLPCSVVQWNASARTTTFVGANGLTASIAAADIATVATDQVTVVNPSPGGGTSAGSPFTVFTPVPGAVRIAAAAQTASSVVTGTEGLLSLPLLSSDRRYAVQVLASTDGVTEIPGTVQNIFVRDTCAGAPSGCTPSSTLVSIGLSSNPADGDSISPSISADGRYVAFLSSAMNLVDSDTNGVTDVFVRDTCAGAPSGCTPSTQRVSVATDGTQANSASTSATIGASGRYITFKSAATNLSSVSPSASGLFLRDTCVGASGACSPSTEQMDALK
jgi:hypothetical protein